MNKKFLHHQSKRNVITGGPCTGKSSVLRELSSRGYFTVPEAARCVFEDMKSSGRCIDRKHPDVQKEIMDTQYDQEEDAISGRPIFLDRGIGDNMVYMEMAGIDTFYIMDNYMEDLIDRYDRVFLLEPLPYKQDDVRSEDEEEAQHVHEMIRDIYTTFGYNVIDVPVMSISDRADFIERHTYRVARH